MTLTFFVAGEPIPQGSTRPFRLKTGQIVTIHGNRNLKDWRQRVATEAQKLNAPCSSHPVVLTLTFALKRPKSLPRKVKNHTKKPDLDKLVRAVMDALTGIVYRDDSQVIEIRTTKFYTPDDCPSGVHITLEYVEV